MYQKVYTSVLEGGIAYIYAHKNSAKSEIDILPE